MSENIVRTGPDQSVVVSNSEDDFEILLDESGLKEFVYFDSTEQDLVIVEKESTDVVRINPQDREAVVIQPAIRDGVVVSTMSGSDGEDGKDGKDGEDGEDGVYVVEMTIDEDSHLISTLSNGVQLDAGIVSSQPSGSQIKTFSFTTPSQVWVCDHNFDRRAVQVVTYDASGVEILGDVSYETANRVVVNWYFPTTGTAQIIK